MLVHITYNARINATIGVYTMFSQLSDRLQETFKKLTGQSKLTEDNIQSGLGEIRAALLEADVALPIVTDFIAHIREKAMGQAVMKSLSPGQALVKIVKDELTLMMGEHNNALNLSTQPPAVILMLGLQGSGKTTTAAKLARKLILEQKKKVMLVSLDVYRPAAIEQLQTLANQLETPCYPSSPHDQPTAITKAALDMAAKSGMDVVILDTAGRLHIDEAMMEELKAVHQVAQPIESLLVLDSMTGQDAVNIAKHFSELLPLTGLILTKADGDSRGGAALSIRQVTGTPIKFMGVGEKIDALEAFHPDRVASRILGMGDVLSLIEEVEQKVDKQQAKKVAKKMQKGSFDLEDFREQLQQMQNMGGLAGILSKLPGGMKLPTDAIDNKMFLRQEAIINSMTRKERRYPDIINGSRKRRIAKGSGVEIADVNRLLKQFTQMQKMMKKMTQKGGMKNMMRQMQGMQGMMPPGGMFQ